MPGQRKSVRAARIALVLVPVMCVVVLSAYLYQSRKSVVAQRPGVLIGELKSYQSFAEVTRILDSQARNVTQQTAHSATKEPYQFADCETLNQAKQTTADRPKHDTCFVIVSPYVVFAQSVRAHLFLYNDRLTEVRLYPRDVPAFHTRVSDEYSVVLFGENRLSLSGNIEIGTHLDSAGHVAYFWVDRVLLDEYDDWLRRYASP